MNDYSGWFAAINLPPILVAIAGVVLLAVRRRQVGPTSMLLGIVGAGLVLVSSSFYLIWSLIQQQVADNLSKIDGDTGQNLIRVNLGLDGVAELIHASGIGLLLIALSVRRTPANPPTPGYPIDRPHYPAQQPYPVPHQGVQQPQAPASAPQPGGPIPPWSAPPAPAGSPGSGGTDQQ